MPAEPLEYRIFLALQAVFQGIRARDGYFYDVDDVAVLLDPDQSAETLVSEPRLRPLVVLEQADGEEWTYSPANQATVVMPVIVNWIGTSVPAVDDVTGAPQPVLDNERPLMFWRGCADIERAVVQDVSLGGLVTDVRFKKRLWRQEATGQDVWAEITLDVQFRREYGRS